MDILCATYVYAYSTYSIYNAAVHTVYCSCTYSILQLYIQYTAVVHTVYCSCTYSMLQLYIQYTTAAHTVYCSCTYSILQFAEQHLYMCRCLLGCTILSLQTLRSCTIFRKKSMASVRDYANIAKSEVSS